MSGTSDFGAELRLLRRAAGLSLAQLATRVHFSKGYLSKIENGVAPPTLALATLCDTELATGGRLSALLPQASRRLRSKPDVRSRLSCLPPATAHFVGRAGEIAEIAGVLAEPMTGAGIRICAVSGMAGVGKTALAVRVAHRLEAHFVDGCLFATLRGGSDVPPEATAASALDRFLRLLGVADSDIPASVDDRAAVYRNAVRGRQFLVVLDDVHSADQVSLLLPAEPRCRVLVTSRRRLTALDDAHHMPLPTLPPDKAVALFRSVVGTDQLPLEQDATASLQGVVGQCGLLPLAIRIAAARLRSHPAWTLPQLAARLASESARLSELDDGERSVASAFELSYQGLPPQRRRMFALLALHPGQDFDGLAAAAITGSDRPQAERDLDQLLEAHLLQQQAPDRYPFHDLVRIFAGQRGAAHLTDAVRREAVDRMLDHYLHGADLADRLITPHRFRFPASYEHPPTPPVSFADHDAAVGWLDTELPNLVAACGRAAETGRHDRCWQLAFALRGYFYLTKSWDAWQRTHELAAVAARKAGAPKAEAVTLNNLGLVLLERSDHDGAAECYDQASELFSELGDEHGINNCLANKAWVHYYRGDHVRALRDLRSAYAFYRRVDAHRNMAITLRGIGFIELETGQPATSIANLDRALLTFNELGLDQDATTTLNHAGKAYERLDQLDRAWNCYQQALVLARVCHSKYEEATAEAGLALVAYRNGQHAPARDHWSRALSRFASLGVQQASEVQSWLDALDQECPIP